MEQFIDSLHKSIKEENWFSALFMAVSVPDICGGLENKDERNNKIRFIHWFNRYLSKKYKYITGEAFWQLRCSILHGGTHYEKKLRKELSGAELLVVSYHESPFHDSYVRWDEYQSFVFLRVDRFCNDVCCAIEEWLEDVKDNKAIQAALKELFFMEKGFKAKKMILGNVHILWGDKIIKGLYTDFTAKKGFQPFWKTDPSK